MLQLQSGGRVGKTILSPLKLSILCLHYIFPWYCVGRNQQSVTPGNLVILILSSVAVTCTNWSFWDKHSATLIFLFPFYGCIHEDEMFSSSGGAGSFKEATTVLGPGHQGLFL